ncbi:MAG: head decoration protein [Planctomycetota bacterium]
MADPSFTQANSTVDRLIGGDKKLVTREVTLTDLAAGALTRGTVLGMITASGKYAISKSAAVDGSQTARAILAKDADPSGGDVTAVIYDEGEFNEDRLTLGTGHTAASVREDLRAVGIHLKKPVAA